MVVAAFWANRAINYLPMVFQRFINLFLKILSSLGSYHSKFCQSISPSVEMTYVAIHLQFQILLKDIAILRANRMIQPVIVQPA